jgi:ADP-ribose pyrophosphatase
MPNNDDAHLVETKLASEVAFDGKLLLVRSDKVKLPDGGAATREYVVHPGAALVVPVLADGRFVLERQFRYPVRRVVLEFPAGKIDQRELREEVGYAASAWKPLCTIHPEVGYSTEFIDVFEATGLTKVGQALDEGEFLDVVTMTEDELLFTYDCGGFTDGKSIAALFAWRRQRGK